MNSIPDGPNKANTIKHLDATWGDKSQPSIIKQFTLCTLVLNPSSKLRRWGVFGSGRTTMTMLRRKCLKLFIFLKPFDLLGVKAKVERTEGLDPFWCQGTSWVLF